MTIPVQSIPTLPIPPSGSLSHCSLIEKICPLAKEMKNARCRFHARLRRYGGVAVINNTNCPSPGPGEATPRLDRLPTVRVEKTKTGLYWKTSGSGRSGKECGARTRKWMSCAVQPCMASLSRVLLGSDDESMFDGGVALQRCPDLFIVADRCTVAEPRKLAILKGISCNDGTREKRIGVRKARAHNPLLTSWWVVPVGSLNPLGATPPQTGGHQPTGGHHAVDYDPEWNRL